MEVVDDLLECPRPAGGSVVTIGAYDGVHTGHQRLIAEVRALAASRGCSSAVVTFDRHPALVVRPESAPKLLTDLDTKLELLEATGIDYTVVVHFDEARSKEPAADFVETVLVGCLNARVVVVGHDFHFGHRREGNVAFLQRIGPASGFEVQGVSLFPDGQGSEPVSSTRIRSAIAAGDVEAAAVLLGRGHLLHGLLVGRGALEVPDIYAVPPPGGYRGWWRADGGVRVPARIDVDRAGAPLGVRPDRGEPPVGGGGRVELVARLD